MSASHRLVEVMSIFGRIIVGEGADVVNEQNVDAVPPGSLQAVFVGSHHTVIAVIMDRMKRQGSRPPMAGRITRQPRLHEPADLA